MSTTSPCELLGFHHLASTDETADEFQGLVLVHRAGSSEPVESVPITVRRAVLEDLRVFLDRLLTRSTRLLPPSR